MNNGQIHDEVIDVDGAGVDVLTHLTRAHRHSTRDEWAVRIDAGEVQLDGVITTAMTTLRKGQVLAWHKPPWDEPAVPTDIVVLFHDDDLIAVHKPAGLPTLPGSGYLEHTLLTMVRALSASTAKASPVHRLDRGTSGIVLFVQHADAARHVQQQWDSGTVQKRYRALVQGVVVDDRVVVDVAIGPVPDVVVGELFAASPNGKRARSIIKVVERRDETTLIDVTLETGRPHQIRIHTAAIAHPLVDEPLYGVGGVRAATSTARPGDEGFLLHAHMLTLRHPRTNEALTLTALPPSTLRIS